jgi:hypothetical protein
MRIRAVCLLAVIVCSRSMLALQPADAPTGTVTGHVFYADLNAPARFANVTLEPLSLYDEAQASEDDHTIHTVAMSGTQTTLDGSFAIAHVAPGSYYVIASAPGYLSPFDALGLTQTDLTAADDDMRQLLLKNVPHVLVQAGLTSNIEIPLQRGAVVAGTILYDDGTPASGLRVQVLMKKDGKWVSAPEPTGSFGMAQQIYTDDRGNYRIANLAPREYLVEVSLKVRRTSMMGNNGMIIMASSDDFQSASAIPVYSGNVTRSKDGHPFTLKLGEERDGEDIQIPLGKLHTISGYLAAARDGHVLNDGEIQLLYADDKSVAASVGLSTKDSTFVLNFIPEGDYILHVAHAADAEYTEVPQPPGVIGPPQTENKIIHHYGTADQPIHVDGDIAGITIAVPEASSNPQTASR